MRHKLDLFKILGTIAINNAEANKALDETGSKGEKAQGKLSKAFSAMGHGAVEAGKLIAKGLAVGGAAMAGLTVKALQLGGDLEQNMGGAEAVFGELGETISGMSVPMQTYDAATGKLIETTSNLEDVSKQAYANMGLSQSDYLATANKMGALFKGAGFETQEALNMSTEAMQRAADVASIMGIDTESAMEAVAGAAKGNFTMMDNLGVAMNDTAIQAYALEKGISKSTSEMSQQEKIGLAMEMFLDKTSYAAGNYAKENATLAGSLGTAKAALTNFLAGSGDVESLVSSFSNLANVVVTSLQEIAPRLTTGLTDLVNQVMPLLPPLIQQLLPIIIDGAVALIDGLVTALPSIISALSAALPTLINGVMQLIDGILQALPEILNSLLYALVEFAPVLIDGLTQVIVSLCNNFIRIIQPLIDYLPELLIVVIDAIAQNLPILIEGFVQLLNEITTMLPEIIQVLVDVLPEALQMILDAITENLPMLIEGLVQFVMALVEMLPEILQALVDATPTVISMLIEAILMNLPVIIMGLIQVVIGIVAALPEIFGSLISAIPAVLSGIWDGLAAVFGNLGGWFAGIFGDAWEGVKNSWSAVVDFFSGVWDGIVKVFSVIGNWFKTQFTQAWNNIKSAWSSVTKWFSDIWSGITKVFSVVGNWFKNAFSQAWNGIVSIWSGVTSWFGGIWSGITGVFSGVGSWFSNKFSEAWNAITNIFSNVVGFFGGIWNKISSTFSELGTKIGDSISGAVKGAINGLIGMVENTINGFFKLINGAIKAINSIPGVNIPRIKMLSFPRLENGGVLEKGQVGLLEGNGAEAVVPLEKNEKWIKATAEDLKEQLQKEGLFNYGQIGDGMAEGFSSVKNTMPQVGGDIIDGFWSGISRKTSGVINRIEDFCGRVTETVKSFFGINSPSTLFRDEVGKQLAEGVAVGIEEKTETAESASEEMGRKILDAAQKKLDAYTAYNELTLADEVAFWDAVRMKCAEGTEARLSADQKYLEAKKSLNEGLLTAENELQAALDEIYQRIDDRAQELLGTFSLFESFTADEAIGKKDMFTNLGTQIAALNKYQDRIEVLRVRIGDTALFKELEAMGVSGLNQITLMSNMAEHELQAYVAMYEQRNALARKTAEEELSEETFENTQKAYQTFADKCSELGVEVVTSTQEMQQGASTAFATMEQSISTSVENIGVNISDKMGTALDVVLSTLESMTKAFENFMPNIKLPHFKADGVFDLESGSLPTISVEWYKKAMDNVMLLDKPTIFGYNSSSGNLMGGGEAGSEMVGGTNTIMGMIQEAVSRENSNIENVLYKILKAIISMDSNMGDNLKDALEDMGLKLNNREFARIVKAVN